MNGEGLAVQPKPKGKLPTWAKVLAFVSAAVIVGGGIGGALGIFWVRRLCLDSINPVYIAGTLRKIGDFSDTQGFHPVVGLRLPGIAGVGFDESQSKLQFDLATYESVTSDPDPKEEIDRWYDFPAVFTGITANFVSIADKGKFDINGHEFNYQTGQLKDPQGAAYKGMIGCLTKGRKVIMVEAATPADHSLDINVVVDFLRKAHSF